MFFNSKSSDMSASGTYCTASFARPNMSAMSKLVIAVGAMILASIFAFWVVLDIIILIIPAALLVSRKTRNAIV